MSNDPRADHLLAALAMRGAMERVIEAYKMTAQAIDDVLALVPDALGDPPALPSVVRWLEIQQGDATLRAEEAWQRKQQVFTYGEML